MMSMCAVGQLKDKFQFRKVEFSQLEPQIINLSYAEFSIAILDLSKAISRKGCKIGGRLLLITNRKSHMVFRLVPKSVTLNDLERRSFRGALRKSG